MHPVVKEQHSAMIKHCKSVGLRLLLRVLGNSCHVMSCHAAISIIMNLIEWLYGSQHISCRELLARHAVHRQWTTYSIFMSSTKEGIICWQSVVVMTLYMEIHPADIVQELLLHHAFVIFVSNFSCPVFSSLLFSFASHLILSHLVYVQNFWWCHCFSTVQ